MPAEQVFGKESMDGLTAVVEVVKAVIWPTLIAGGLWRFNRHIAYFIVMLARSIRRMNRVRWGELELAHERAAMAEARAEAVVKEAVDAVKEDIKTEPSIPQEKKEELVVRIDNTAKRAQEERRPHLFSAGIFGLNIGDMLIEHGMWSVAKEIGEEILIEADRRQNFDLVDLRWDELRRDPVWTFRSRLPWGEGVDMAGFQRKGLIDQNERLTRRGHDALVRAAKENQIRAQKTATPSAPPPTPTSGDH